MTTEPIKKFETDIHPTSGTLERLKSDTHLAILCVFSTVASLAIGSFGIYRLTQGEIIVALFDGLIVAAMLGSLAYAWKTGRSSLAGNVIATLLVAGALFMILGLGLSYLWVFSLMIGIFLLASSRVSILLSFFTATAGRNLFWSCEVRRRKELPRRSRSFRTPFASG